MKKTCFGINKMFRFIKAIFFTTVMFLSCNALKCVSVNNQKCKIRPELIKINSNDLSFYPYNILVNKCSARCKDIDNP